MTSPVSYYVQTTNEDASGQGGDPALIIAHHTSPQQGIIACCAISFYCCIPLIVISGILTAQQHVDNIQIPFLLPFLLCYPELTFQQGIVWSHMHVLS